MPAQVTVVVPASTSNLGPGFDCLGMALALQNRVTLARREEGLEVTIRGEGQGSLVPNGTDLVARAARRLFKEIGHDPGGLQIVQENKIPVGGGLGSSGAAVVGGLLAANALVRPQRHRARRMRLGMPVLAGSRMPREAPGMISMAPLRASALRCSSAALADLKPSSRAISARVGG